MDPYLIQSHFDLGSGCYTQNRTIIHSFFMDWIGCLFAGLNSPKTETLVRSLGFELETIGRERLKNMDIALVMGYASHCLEIDDSEFIGETHPSGILFSSLFPEIDDCQYVEDLLRAVSVGYLSLLTFGRRFNPNHYESGWHGTGTIGAFAATLGLGYLKDMDPKKVCSSLGVLANLISGLHMSFGSEAKFLNAGRAAQNAILACRLVRYGMKANPIKYNGDKGLLNILNGSETRWIQPELVDFNFVKSKKFPICHCLDPVVCNMQTLVSEEGMHSQDIESVMVSVSEYSRELLCFDRPGNVEQAQFSIPYTIATVILNYPVEITNYFSKFEKCTDFSKKVFVSTDKSLAKMDHFIEVHLRDGRCIKRFLNYDRSFALQDRSFICKKVESILLPYSISSDKLGALLRVINQNVENLKIYELKEMLSETLSNPVFNFRTSG